MEKIIIIGGGGTGAALAHDLALRGFRVSLFEKGQLLCGSSGRHHGLLHSGARYAVHDAEAARECIAENQILRCITDVLTHKIKAL
jgi:glycerol-3-phosphate dehydrogenase